MIDNDITPRLEKLGSERQKYLEFSTLTNELVGLQRFVQAYDFTCAEGAKQKCIDAQEGDTAKRVELAASIEEADAEMATLQQQLKDVIAKKKTEGAGELAALEEKEQARVAPLSTHARSQPTLFLLSLPPSPLPPSLSHTHTL